MKNSLDFYRKNPTPQKVSFLGAPIDFGKKIVGTASAFQHMKEHGLFEIFQDLGIETQDMGSIEVNIGETLGNVDRMALIGNSLASQVYQRVRKGEFCVTIGGDHSVAFGSVSGASVALSGDMGLVWIDAHADANTHHTSLTGNLHGMPAAALLGYGHERLINIFRGGVKIKPENMLYIGLKDLDTSEIDFLQSLGIKTITMFDILTYGMEPVFSSLQSFQERVTSFYVSLDIDAIDKTYAPANFMATHGGLDYVQMSNLASFMGKMEKLVGLDIVEFVPSLDIDNKTLHLLFELLARFLGTNYSWYERYMQKEKIENLVINSDGQKVHDR
ncbi:MAG: hypothetical protein COV59_05445 [Candidatus Magasanikbacteria bacterium CG11_big_fil_rev_8_21_14_0_20_39_34]|uniref:Arginase n=1 Tax=Candidatus Magasanikbacteria bacterium CG11_big_fil_rev_8_21_14_0_20_39_34 TaxID=1974653 RepID=A0A2H0N3X6_9BACT|nr:MAG: hypothetical protein COV59_05445 [Candidatus Magasanikbacteria bacterium CG11_big_fil_rev_8_21_14_0_20_39_34]